jgi:hypothetical protein
MKNINEMKIEEIRIENEKLYNEYLLACEDLQPLITKIHKELKDEITINKETKEQYEETIKELAKEKNYDISEFLDYESYIENTEWLYKELIKLNSNLSCYKIDLKERHDYDNKNKVLAYHYELQFTHDYVNEIYNEYKELFDEYKK